MSREFAAAMKRASAAERGEEVEEIETPAPAGKPKHKTKKSKSLTIRLQESERYDCNPTKRYTLMVIHLGTRRAKDDYDDTWAPTGWTAEEMVGWCDMAQWRLAQRVGVTTDHMGRILSELDKAGDILKEGWDDPDTHMLHCRYQIVEEMVDAHQRKKHTANAKRGSRYAEGSRPSKANGKLHKGMFSTSNQPGITAQRKAIREEDGE